MRIKNEYNEGLSGFGTDFVINQQLKIVDAFYFRWNDMISDNKVTYQVKKVNFELNKNPFLDTLVTGRYSLLIKYVLKVNKELKRKGISDTSYYFTFDGKFKICNANEEVASRDLKKSEK